MPEEFLTIKEAATSLGKAEITIRRFVQRVVKGSDAGRRAMIKPSPEEMQQHTDGPPPAWQISTKLLREQFPSAGQGSETASVPAPAIDDGRVAEVLKSQNATLERQLSVKDEQIKSLTTLVHSLGDQLNERLRESNVLMKGLQERMALPAQVEKPVIDMQPSQPQPDPKPQVSKRAEKRGAKKPQPKRGWFQRLLSGNGKSTA